MKTTKFALLLTLICCSLIKPQLTVELTIQICVGNGVLNGFDTNDTSLVTSQFGTYLMPGIKAPPGPNVYLSYLELYGAQTGSVKLYVS